MKIYVLDDEPIALRGTIKTIQEVLPDAEITGFSRAQKALRHIADTNERPDVVFCDIEMPGISGLDFAVRLKKVCPEARIIFVTAYSQYALEAVEKYGALKGGWLALKRICRCHPFYHGKHPYYDPVP
jgi:putative membrane protein insertion efficiency factor